MKNSENTATQYAKQISSDLDGFEQSILHPYLKRNAKPRIKGEVTDKKLKERNIYQNRTDDKTIVWLEQGKERITPFIVYLTAQKETGEEGILGLTIDPEMNYTLKEIQEQIDEHIRNSESNNGKETKEKSTSK